MTAQCRNLPAQDDHAGWVAHYQAQLRPCGEKTGNAELVACLTLVAPTGMTAAERDTWLKVARHTLKGMPQDLLQLGCKYARETADHPSKVVPAIMRHVHALWQSRLNGRWRAQQALEEAQRPRLERPPAVPREETERIIREVAEEAKRHSRVSAPAAKGE